MRKLSVLIILALLTTLVLTSPARYAHAYAPGDTVAGGINAGWVSGISSSSALNGVVVDTVKLVRAGQTISTIARASNVVSVTLSSTYPNNNLKVGQNIYIDTGTGGTADFKGTFVIASVTDQSHFTYAQTASNETGTIGTNPIAGGNYTTLTAWEAGEGGNLVTANKIATAQVYNDWGAGLSDNPTISGNTTNATCYLRITVPLSERNTGTTGTGFKLAGTFTVADSENITIEYIEATGLATFTNGTITDNGSLYTGGYVQTPLHRFRLQFV